VLCGGRILHSARQLVFVTGVSLKRASESVQRRLEGDVNGSGSRVRDALKRLKNFAHPARLKEQLGVLPAESFLFSVCHRVARQEEHGNGLRLFKRRLPYLLHLRPCLPTLDPIAFHSN